MINKEEKVIMRAIAICYKPFLKPEEALIYCNLERTQFAKKCEEYFILKSSGGYFKREELDKMMAGDTDFLSEQLKKLTGNSK